MSYVTNLALWLQYFSKLTYLLTYLIRSRQFLWSGRTGYGHATRARVTTPLFDAYYAENTLRLGLFRRSFNFAAFDVSRPSLT